MMSSIRPGPDELRAARKKGQGLLLWTFVFSIFVNLLMLAGPLYMLQVYDRVLTSRSQETLLYLTLIAIAAFAAYAALDYVRSRILVVVSAWLDRHLRGAVLSAGLAAKSMVETNFSIDRMIAENRDLYQKAVAPDDLP